MTLLYSIIPATISIFIIVTLFDNTLRSRKSINIFLFYGAFVLYAYIGSLTSFFVNYIPPKLFEPANIFITSLGVFLLTFLYKTNIKKRILIALSEKAMAMASDRLFTIIIIKLNPKFIENITPEKIFIGNSGVKMIQLLFTLIFLLFWNKRVKQHDIQYNILILLTPLVALIINILMTHSTFQDIYSNITTTSIELLLLTLSIINTALVQRSAVINDYKKKIDNLNTELDYQKDKYTQLCSSYRNTRKVIHDTKNHYFTIQEYISNKEYDKLMDYTNATLGELDTTYSLYNTGNLVIDSFFSHYKIQFEQADITFESDINVDKDKINLTDYELCIILGNLLDNGYNHLHKTNQTDEHFYIKLYNDKNDSLIISTKNRINLDNDASNKKLKDTNDNDSLIHGYGLDNIKMITDNHKGMLNISNDNDIYEIIVIIPALPTTK